MSVYVSGHAIKRARERVPGWRDENQMRLVNLVCWEVAEAVRAGRKAKTMPRWAAITRRAKAKAHNVAPRWFVWNHGQTRCYVITRGTAAEKCEWVVVSVLCNNDGEETS